jgi:hypothetical protein
MHKTSSPALKKRERTHPKPASLKSILVFFLLVYLCDSHCLTYLTVDQNLIFWYLTAHDKWDCISLNMWHVTVLILNCWTEYFKVKVLKLKLTTVNLFAVAFTPPPPIFLCVLPLLPFSFFFYTMYFTPCLVLRHNT